MGPLAIALANDAFQDYSSFEEIEAIPPPERGSLYHLRFKPSLLDQPFFRTVTKTGPTEKILKSNSWTTRLKDLGHRAGISENVTVHAFRREALVKADGKVAMTTFYINPLILIKTIMCFQSPTSPTMKLFWDVE